MQNAMSFIRYLWIAILFAGVCPDLGAMERLRVIIETDAGGDADELKARVALSSSEVGQPSVTRVPGPRVRSGPGWRMRLLRHA